MKTLPILGTLALWALAGCASVNFDRSLAQANDSTQAFTEGRLMLARTEAERQQRAELSAKLLAQPLDRQQAVQLALANSPALQALLAEQWAEQARAAQSGRIANPVFTFERLAAGDELELGRLLSFGLLDLITLPERQHIARGRLAQAQTRLAASVVEQVTQVRQAWVRAVAAQQALDYAKQVRRSAEASAELARRMQEAGNFSRLQRAREQLFYADAAARLAADSQAALARREELVRLLGLTPEQAASLRLPERLPELPTQPRTIEALAGAAMGQRLDVQLARQQLALAGRAQRLDLLSSLVDTELGVRRDTRFDNAAGTRTPARGWELALRLPLFDWGGPQRAAMNAQSLAAANRYDATVRRAASQLREAYAGYRTAWELARHLRDEVVPLRKTISEENVLRYNGMLASTFELLADQRAQVAAVLAALDAQQQFWLADAALSSHVIGQPTGLAAASAPAIDSGAGSAGH